MLLASSAGKMLARGWNAWKTIISWIILWRQPRYGGGTEQPLCFFPISLHLEMDVEHREWEAEGRHMGSFMPPTHRIWRHQPTGKGLPSLIEAVLSCTKKDQGAIPKQDFDIQVKSYFTVFKFKKKKKSFITSNTLWLGLRAKQAQALDSAQGLRSERSISIQIPYKRWLSLPLKMKRRNGKCFWMFEIERGHGWLCESRMRQKDISGSLHPAIP